MLNICPLLNMDDQGRLIPRYKIRTKKKVIRAIVDKMEEYAEGGLDYSGKCYISQSACIEDAREVARLVEERFLSLTERLRSTALELPLEVIQVQALWPCFSGEAREQHSWGLFSQI